MERTHVEEFLEAFGQSLARGTFVKATLGKYRGGEPDLRNVYVTLIRVRQDERLSFQSRYRARDEVKNHTVAEGLALVGGMLGETFLSGHLFTTERNLQVEFNRRRESRMISSAPTFTSAPAPAHDRKKRRYVEARGNVYLRALGVTNERGEVRERMGDKFRQINKFVEVVSHAFASSPLAGKKEISILDMGSGKGYLTFAVHDYFNRALGVKARTVGVEARPELVELCNGVAREAGFDGVEFQAGYIGDYEVRDADILIALHACDTATDDAIHMGVRARASVIICAPCCHKQVRPQIEPPAVLGGILRHGILLERQAEMVTDSMRALLLEHAGYAARVFEFISGEHTHKNTMIVGVRREGDEGKREEALGHLEALKEFFGVREQRLAHLLLHGGRPEAEACRECR